MKRVVIVFEGDSDNVWFDQMCKAIMRWFRENDTTPADKRLFLYVNNLDVWCSLLEYVETETETRVVNESGTYFEITHRETGVDYNVIVTNSGEYRMDADIELGYKERDEQPEPLIVDGVLIHRGNEETPKSGGKSAYETAKAVRKAYK